MALTPNIMMAAEGIQANDALAVVPLSTGDYLAEIIVADYLNTVALYEAHEPADISQTVVDNFIKLLDSTAPYISNRVPAAAGTDLVNYTEILTQHVENLFPTVDPVALATNNQIFVQYALISMGAKDTANKYVNSAVNGAALTAQTFTTQDALITGNLAAISSDPQAWGEELVATGVLFDFAKLDNIGTPQAIIEALMKANMLGLISDELTVHGIDVVTLTKAINSNPELSLTPIVQKRCYDAFKLVIDDKLSDILEVMGFEPSVTSLADLLDLRKIFPTTFDTITAPDGSGNVKHIYTAAGNITDDFSNVVAPLSAVIQEELATANYVFTCSLGQVKGIRNSTPAAIGSVAACIEDNTGLPNTGSLTQALPTSTSTNIIANMGGGSGPDSTFYLSDFIGAAAGIPQNANFAILSTNFDAVQTAGGFDDIAEILLIMREVLGGINTPRVEFTYTPGALPPPDDYQIEILAGYPGEGFYNSSTSYPYGTALSALMVEMTTAVANYIAAYPTEHAALTLAYTSNTGNVVAAIKQLWKSNVRFETTHVVDDLGGPDEFWYQTDDPDRNGLSAQESSTLAFAENLGNYGKLTDKGNIAEILEAMTTDTLGGNAIIAAMREGRNLTSLYEAGITSDNQISDQPSIVEPGIIT